MKLRNKKTGEIHDITQVVSLSGDMNKKFAIYSQSEGHNYAYKTLSELNEEWEDVPEEPKEYWCIREDGVVEKRPYPIIIECAEQEYRDAMREIGNYFETKEEAEKAAEKLKAWKRLKDKRFEFTEWYKPDGCEPFIVVETNIDYDDVDNMELQKDLDLLFGGEE